MCVRECACAYAYVEVFVQGVAMPGSFAVAVVSQVLAALDHLHKLGIIHCDLRAANVLVHTLEPHVIVSDFGMSRQVTHATGADISSFYKIARGKIAGPKCMFAVFII